MNCYVGLVHYPVLDKYGNTVTTSVTNMDIHDISRSCLTYGVKKFFIINHNERQKEILMKILNFWQTEPAIEYKIDRHNALSIVSYTRNIDDAIKEIKTQEGISPLVFTTTALKRENQIDFKQAKRIFKKDPKPVFLIFGTGNGLAESVHFESDHVLEPIKGIGRYNHLSVRSAVAIVLDRITSEKYKEEL